MNVQQNEKYVGRLLNCHLSGNLVKEDYAHLIPTVDY